MSISARLIATVVCCITLGLSHFVVAQNAAAPSATRQRQAPAVPVPIEEGKAALTARNTTIQFIGTHVGDEPNPRTGYFTKFTGALAIDEATKALKAASLDIDTSSLITPIGRLTGHLQSPDFFDVRQYPKATFASKKIEVTDAARGRYKVTGDLTIREITKPISFPATLRITDNGGVLTSKFTIKRSDFGMTFGPDRVVDEVELTVSVGRATPKVRPQ